MQTFSVGLLVPAGCNSDFLNIAYYTLFKKKKIYTFFGHIACEILVL